ncbi:MAG: hypothetical protein FJ304_22565 [Planctomycetes bacterium]|nr:hypothetical protein [Planctomycetota bacterium]
MRARPSRFRLLAAAVAGLILTAAPARADMVYIGESTLPGLFTGTVSVTNQTTTSAVITVKLTNVSPAANGGYITGLAFNDPNSTAKGNIGTVTSFAPSYTPATGQSFSLLGAPTYNNSVATSPYGNFDVGAAVGGDWLGGGMPQDGLAVGQTGTFVFNVTGTSMLNLSAANILAAMSSNGTAGFAVRFRGFKDGSSDKDIAGVICPPPPPPPPPGVVPAPPGLVLAGMGFGCLVLGRLRLRRK